MGELEELMRKAQGQADFLVELSAVYQRIAIVFDARLFAAKLWSAWYRAGKPGMRMGV